MMFTDIDSERSVVDDERLVMERHMSLLSASRLTARGNGHQTGTPSPDRPPLPITCVKRRVPGSDSLVFSLPLGTDSGREGEDAPFVSAGCRFVHDAKGVAQERLDASGLPEPDPHFGVHELRFEPEER